RAPRDGRLIPAGLPPRPGGGRWRSCDPYYRQAGKVRPAGSSAPDRAEASMRATGDGPGCPGVASRGARLMSSAFTSRVNRTIRILWLVELLTMLLAVTAAVWLRFLDDPAGRGLFVETAPVRSLLVALFLPGAMAAFGLYRPHVRHSRIDLVLRIALAFGFGGIGLLVLYYLVPQTYIGRGVLAIALGIGF